MLILAQLKVLQRLGYMPMIYDVPPAIIEHLCAVLGVRPLPRTTPARYDRSISKSRHQNILLLSSELRQAPPGQEFLQMFAARFVARRIHVPHR